MQLTLYNYQDLNHIAAQINKGKAAVIETDTVVGLVCKDKRVLYQLKDRDLNKPLVTFVSDFVQTDNKLALDLMKKHWPGALTLVIAGRSYRMPDHQRLLRLLELTGPLYSTSCNISGQPPIKSCIDAKELFSGLGDKVIIVRGKQRDRIPSTVYDCDLRKTIRPGRIAID